MGGINQIEDCDLKVVLVVEYACIQLSTDSIQASQQICCRLLVAGRRVLEIGQCALEFQSVSVVL